MVIMSRTPPLSPMDTPLPKNFASHTRIISSVVVFVGSYAMLIYIFHVQMTETSAGKFRHKSKNTISISLYLFVSIIIPIFDCIYL